MTTTMSDCTKRGTRRLDCSCPYCASGATLSDGERLHVAISFRDSSPGAGVLPAAKPPADAQMARAVQRREATADQRKDELRRAWQGQRARHGEAGRAGYVDRLGRAWRG